MSLQLLDILFTGDDLRKLNVWHHRAPWQALVRRFVLKRWLAVLCVCKQVPHRGVFPWMAEHIVRLRCSFQGRWCWLCGGRGVCCWRFTSIKEATLNYKKYSGFRLALKKYYYQQHVFGIKSKGLNIHPFRMLYIVLLHYINEAFWCCCWLRYSFLPLLYILFNIYIYISVSSFLKCVLDEM